MNSSLRFGLLIFVDVILGFLVLCVLPFAWILKDGLGPDSVSTSGFAAIWKTFMTFYVGPVILLFIAFDLFLRKIATSESDSPRKASTFAWVAVLLGVAALSIVFAGLLFGG